MFNYNLMNNNPKYFNNNNSDIVIVTAFFNINRENWNTSKRDVNYYLDSLKILLSTENKIWCKRSSSIGCISFNNLTLLIRTSYED